MAHHRLSGGLEKKKVFCRVGTNHHVSDTRKRGKKTCLEQKKTPTVATRLSHPARSNAILTPTPAPGRGRDERVFGRTPHHHGWKIDKTVLFNPDPPRSNAILTPTPAPGRGRDEHVFGRTPHQHGRKIVCAHRRLPHLTPPS